MSVNLEFVNKDKIMQKINNLHPEISRAVKQAVFFSGLLVEGDIKKSIQRGPKSGQSYFKLNPKRIHVASSPGEPPASDTGRLAGSISTKRMDGDMTVTIGTNIEYAKGLEFGTFRVLPRPFMFPAFEKNKKAIHNKIQKAIRDAVKNGTKK